MQKVRKRHARWILFSSRRSPTSEQGMCGNPTDYVHLPRTGSRRQCGYSGRLGAHGRCLATLATMGYRTCKVCSPTSERRETGCFGIAFARTSRKRCSDRLGKRIHRRLVGEVPSQGRRITVNCEHPQCCICLKRECQQTYLQPRFKKYGGLPVCGDSCLSIAVSIAYAAACKLGGCQEKQCGVAKEGE